jgi:hypothetical protein
MFSVYFVFSQPDGMKALHDLVKKQAAVLDERQQREVLAAIEAGPHTLLAPSSIAAPLPPHTRSRPQSIDIDYDDDYEEPHHHHHSRRSSFSSIASFKTDDDPPGFTPLTVHRPSLLSPPLRTPLQRTSLFDEPQLGRAPPLLPRDDAAPTSQDVSLLPHKIPSTLAAPAINPAAVAPLGPPPTGDNFDEILQWFEYKKQEVKQKKLDEIKLQHQRLKAAEDELRKMS